jgi:hypothetical protein
MGTEVGAGVECGGAGRAGTAGAAPVEVGLAMGWEGVEGMDGPKVGVVAVESGRCAVLTMLRARGADEGTACDEPEGALAGAGGAGCGPAGGAVETDAAGRGVVMLGFEPRAAWTAAWLTASLNGALGIAGSAGAEGGVVAGGGPAGSVERGGNR